MKTTRANKTLTRSGKATTTNADPINADRMRAAREAIAKATGGAA